MYENFLYGIAMDGRPVYMYRTAVSALGGPAHERAKKGYQTTAGI
jgi:hypothetical protein